MARRALQLDKVNRLNQLIVVSMKLTDDIFSDRKQLCKKDILGSRQILGNLTD